MTNTLIGYARCSTDRQDLAAQEATLDEFGVAADRIYTDRGLTGTNRLRPGLDQALAAGTFRRHVRRAQARPARALRSRRPRDC